MKKRTQIIQLIKLSGLMVLLLLLNLLSTQPAQAANYDVLFINYGVYTNEGWLIRDELINAGASVHSVLLEGNAGAVATALADHTFEQIWSYDLSSYPDNYPLDSQSVADWYAAQTDCAVIMDGRILSSFWRGRSTTEGRSLVQNYFANLSAHGCGLVMGTDHSSYADGGTNPTLDLMGFGPFTGNFGGSFPVDNTNPLMNTPNSITSLSNDSTTGQAPAGLQSNGVYLYTVGYHSGNPDTPGISSTIDGTLGFNASITNPADGSAFSSGSVSFTADVTGGTTPYNCTWYSNIDGSLGTGTSISVSASSLSSGGHVITIECTDGRTTPSPRYDEDSINIEIQTCIDSAQSGNWADVDTWVGSTVPDISDGVCIQNGHTVTLTAAAAAEALWVFSGGTLDLVTYGFTVENGVTNNGMLRQTQTVDGSGAVNFMQIRNSGNTTDQYRGVDIAGGVTLGATVVEIMGNTAVCNTSNDGGSYRDRCFMVNPVNAGSVSITLHTTPGEDDISDDAFFQHASGSTWTQGDSCNDDIGDGGTCTGTDIIFASPARFLIGSQTNNPTAVTLQSFSATNQPINLLGILLVGMLLMGLGAFWLRRR